MRQRHLRAVTKSAVSIAHTAWQPFAGSAAADQKAAVTIADFVRKKGFDLGVMGSHCRGYLPAP